MQTQITRSLPRLTRTCSRQVNSRRSYAQQAPDAKSSAPQSTVSAGRQNRIPVIAMVSIAVGIPVFYLLQGFIGTGNKTPGSGKSEILEARRKHGTENEYRDPRDSSIKTSSVDGPRHRTN